MTPSLLDLSVIILTYNEEIHIARCLDNVAPIASAIYIIDCYSTDRTLEIAQRYERVHVLQNRWENSYARQFNWALEKAKITTEWVLRLDADEYLLPELVSELQEKLPQMPADVSGLCFNRRHIFLDKWMRRGTYPVTLIRLFRYGKGMCEQRFMDEHIQLTQGRVVQMEHDFCDHNLNDLSWFCHKHVNYAIREAADLLDIELDLTGAAQADAVPNISTQAGKKRIRKHRYARLPLFWRSTAYFCYRYFIRGAFLEGKAGFLWTFIQGWWYRTLVDAKVYEIKKECGTDRDKIIAYLHDHYGIKF